VAALRDRPRAVAATPSSIALLSRLGARGTALRRWRLVLLAAWIGLVLFLLSPYAPWRLPGDPLPIPHPGQSRIHTILSALGWAAALNAGLVALLLASSRWWAREAPPRTEPDTPPRPTLRSAEIALLAAACLLAGALRWNLAHGGVWWDEAWTLRHAIVGALEPDPDDPAQVEFEPAPWTDTLWYYRKPTNHALYSIAARTSIDVWRTVARAPPAAWDEFALRFPAFAAALLSVALIGLLVRDLGYARAAPVAALLLAIHPVHVRFGADGRGYAFMVLFTIAGTWCLLHALRAGRWRWWLGYAASQAALLWVHPASLYVPLGLTGAALVGIWRGPGSREARLVQLARLAAVNVLAAIAVLQVMAPNLTQGIVLMAEWRKEEADPGSLPRRIWLFLATGLPLNTPRSPDSTEAFPTLRTLWGGGFWVRAVALGVLPALTALGAVRALRRPGPGRWVLLGVALAVPLTMLHRSFSGFLLIERFTLYGLAALVPFLAIGTETVVTALVPKRFARAGVPIGLAAALAAFAAFLAPQTRVLLERPHMPTRELAAFLAEAERATPGGILRAGAGIGGQVLNVYDPWLEHVESGAALAALCERSRREDRPLYVLYGYHRANHTGRFAELFRELDDRRDFEPVARFTAIESEFVYRVLRYTGRPRD
jgi:hypothetical protein